jgi:hypothetical protein
MAFIFESHTAVTESGNTDRMKEEMNWVHVALKIYYGQCYVSNTWD